MGEDEYSLSVSCIVADYMSHRIQQDGFNYQVSPTRNCPNSRVLTTVRKMCSEFEQRFQSEFNDMCLTTGDEFDGESYMQVLDELIVEGVNWGRVIAIFSYAGAMSTYCVKNNKANQVDWIREWTCSFISSRVENWINQNGGWKGLVEFFEKGPAKPEQEQGGWRWMVGSAVGAVVFGALIASRG